MPRKPHRIAAIDIGTNSIHMIIVEAVRDTYRVIDKEKEMVQLGRGSLEGNPLTDDAMERAVATLGRMGEIARRWKADEVYAVATSAVREAPNRRKFLRAAQAAAGFKIRVIAGEEEADYIYRAVRSAVDFHGSTALCIDIGGGSVELITGTQDEVFFTQSVPLGALRLSQKFLSAPRPAPAAITKCRNFIRKQLRKPLSRIRALGFDLVIGTSGTILSLAEIASPRAANEGAGGGLSWLDRQRLEEAIVRLSSLSVEQRVSQLGLDTKRAETILGGALVLAEILRSLRLKRIQACTAALREGVVQKALENRRTSARPERSVRHSSVIQLGEQSKFDKVHAEQVARLALRIFDQTSQLHKLRPADRELLEYAALLHEIGIHVSYQGHHKHSYYLIRHGGLKGFTEDQVAVIANVARYYRKSAPGEDHENLAELSPSNRAAVEKMTAILRIADGLDRGRRQAVRDVGVVIDGRKVRFQIRPRLEPEVELESAEKRAKYFALYFERKVGFEIIKTAA